MLPLGFDLETNIPKTVKLQRCFHNCRVLFNKYIHGDEQILHKKVLFFVYTTPWMKGYRSNGLKKAYHFGTQEPF
jgi:hypothetical protein